MSDWLDHGLHPGHSPRAMVFVIVTAAVIVFALLYLVSTPMVGSNHE